MGTRLANRIAIVTGSGQGIGRAVACAFAREGATVVVATRTEAHGAETCRLIEAEGGKAMLHTVDLADHDAARAMVAHAAAACGGIDILVHNASTSFGRRPIEQVDFTMLDGLFNINVKALYTLTQAVLPHLRKRGGGRIIVTSSVTGPKVTMPGSGAYATAKAALTGFIHTAALELAAENITVNGVEPGYIDTPGLAAFKAKFGAERIAHFIPAKRLGRPEEIAGPMVFLASDDASYVTGETIVVDGGARLPESPTWAG
ncbi:MAG: SDR family oxidoreductase [Proteobacteria bacterium]|nr:SDR family oxidoreductase [Pseudomonadota bacterium]